MCRIQQDTLCASLLVAVLVLVAPAYVFGAVEGDEVKVLPGWNKPLPSGHYRYAGRRYRFTFQ